MKLLCYLSSFFFCCSIITSCLNINCQPTDAEILISKKEFHQIQNTLSRQEKLLQEIKAGEVFINSIADSNWMFSKGFSPSGWSASFTFLYALFRILNDCNPTSILEMGIGQTTKMTSQYVAFKNKAAKLLVIDHNQYWIDLFKSQITDSENLQILKLDLENALFNGEKTSVYKDLVKNVRTTKFDLIIVDGGDRKYRTSVFDLIPQNLSSSFVIVIDDYHFQDKKQMGQALLAKLKNEKIAHGTAIFSGMKKQLVIFSPNFSFLKSI